MRRLHRKALAVVEHVATHDSAGSLSLRSIVAAALLFATMALIAATLQDGGGDAAAAVPTQGALP